MTFVIPEEIFDRRDLSHMEKSVLAQIIFWTNGDKGCFARNEKFKELFGISDPTITRILRRLIALNLITRTSKATKYGEERHLYPSIKLSGGSIDPSIKMIEGSDPSIKLTGPIDQNDRTPSIKMIDIRTEVLKTDKKEEKEESILPFADSNVPLNESLTVALVTDINRRSGKKYTPSSYFKDMETLLKKFPATTVEDLLLVSEVYAQSWLNDEKMAIHYKPAALLRSTKFADKLDTAKNAAPVTPAKRKAHIGTCPSCFAEAVMVENGRCSVCTEAVATV